MAIRGESQRKGANCSQFMARVDYKARHTIRCARGEICFSSVRTRDEHYNEYCRKYGDKCELLRIRED